MNSANDPKVIVALDYASETDALNLVEQLDPSMCKLKIGKELFTAAGPALVKKVVDRGYQVFLDLKFHDIPNTVASACAVAAGLGVWMMNVHASGGRKMMETAGNRLAQLSQRPLLIGVTILTSLSDDEIREIGYSGSTEKNVLNLAQLAADSGLDGVVCSPLEATAVRQATNDSFVLVTPGVRPAFAATDDQKRIMTPADALGAGANYLVVGRPITAAPSPIDNLQRILDEIPS
ncbi:MAG: orotidine-5'-phosphate decarboxylase [Chromatiales bacterium]|jgi:orotidine-5'-phosphate decarboxylase